MKTQTKRTATRRSGVETFRERFPFPLARSLWVVEVPYVGTIEAFMLGRTIVLIEDYVSGDGWQAFTPTSDEGRIDLTLEAIAVRAGV